MLALGMDPVRRWVHHNLLHCVAGCGLCIYVLLELLPLQAAAHGRCPLRCAALLAGGWASPAC